MKLSVIIPVYNEYRYIETLLSRVLSALPQVQKEIIIVDDGSTDGTREWLIHRFRQTNPQPVLLSLEEGALKVYQKAEFSESCSFPRADVRLLLHDRNRGKGAALRTGFKAATGEVLVIQDADLEYDPRDWESMWRLITEDYADVVYGSRFYGKPHRVLYYHHFLGNKIISNLINMLCNTTLSDIEVCYKMFRREVLEGLTLTCNDFGFEVEFTVKVVKQKRWRIYEVGIHYYALLC